MKQAAIALGHALIRDDMARFIKENAASSSRVTLESFVLDTEESVAGGIRPLDGFLKQNPEYKMLWDGLCPAVDHLSSSCCSSTDENRSKMTTTLSSSWTEEAIQLQGSFDLFLTEKDASPEVSPLEAGLCLFDEAVENTDCEEEVSLWKKEAIKLQGNFHLFLAEKEATVELSPLEAGLRLTDAVERLQGGVRAKLTRKQATLKYEMLGSDFHHTIKQSRRQSKKVVKWEARKEPSVRKGFGSSSGRFQHRGKNANKKCKTITYCA